jgi:hypothetical protein
MSNAREFDDSLGHAGANAYILNAFKRKAHEIATLMGLQQVQYTNHFQMEIDFAPPDIRMLMMYLLTMTYLSVVHPMVMF